MEKNIFEGAKFGDKYIDTNNVLWLYISHWDPHNTGTGMYNLIPDKGFTLQEKYPITHFNSDGTQGFNKTYRLRKYYESISEGKLVELAINESPELQMEECYSTWVKGFKAGYRKAIEE